MATELKSPWLRGAWQATRRRRASTPSASTTPPSAAILARGSAVCAVKPGSPASQSNVGPRHFLAGRRADLHGTGSDRVGRLIHGDDGHRLVSEHAIAISAVTAQPHALESLGPRVSNRILQRGGEGGLDRALPGFLAVKRNRRRGSTSWPCPAGSSDSSLPARPRPAGPRRGTSAGRWGSRLRNRSIRPAAGSLRLASEALA